MYSEQGCCNCSCCNSCSGCCNSYDSEQGSCEGLDGARTKGAINTGVECR